MRLVVVKIVATLQYHSEFIELFLTSDFLFNYRGQNSENEDRLSDGEKEQKSSVSFPFNVDQKSEQVTRSFPIQEM